jgi:SSS family solute:Na+ symporter
MHWIDWSLLVATLVAVFGVMMYTRRYLRSVADFMAGGRFAGRYLLANARGEAGYGVATAVAIFELIYMSGTISTWWTCLLAPVPLMAGILGFIIYRYRETRALTLAQFFEMRYSRRFRLFTGVLGFGAGILNYGITPAIQARFFVYFLRLPVTVDVGPWTVPTFALIMADRSR